MKTIDWIMLGFRLLGNVLAEIVSALQNHKDATSTGEKE